MEEEVIYNCTFCNNESIKTKLVNNKQIHLCVSCNDAFLDK